MKTKATPGVPSPSMTQTIDDDDTELQSYSEADDMSLSDDLKHPGDIFPKSLQHKAFQ